VRRIGVIARVVKADDYGRRDAGLVTGFCRVLEAHGGDDVLAVLVQPLRCPQEHLRVVAGHPQLPVSLALFDELDALAQTR
jgi:hypothetical protein